MGLATNIINMLRDEHVGITTDDKTSSANDLQLSLTVAFITAE